MEKVALDKTNGMRNGVSHLYTTIPSHLLILAALLYHFFFLCELETNDTLVKKPLEEIQTMYLLHTYECTLGRFLNLFLADNF